MRIGLAFDLKPTGDPNCKDQYEEYDPPETINSISKAIQDCGHEVVDLSGGREFLHNVLREKVDFVFNISEGRGIFRSREGQIPSVLEMLEIPYSFSDPLTLSISLAKPLCKKMVGNEGVKIAKGIVISDNKDLGRIDKINFSPPFFIKPAFEGSSKGITRKNAAHNIEEAALVTKELLEIYGQPVLIEEFIKGDEVTVGVIGNSPPKVIGAMLIRPKGGRDPLFSYTVEVKRDYENLVAYEIPPPIPDKIKEKLFKSAVKAFLAIGCRDIARVDFRISEGEPVFLEINPLPGLSPIYGDLPMLANGMGINYQNLMNMILDVCFKRLGLN